MARYLRAVGKSTLRPPAVLTQAAVAVDYPTGMLIVLTHRPRKDAAARNTTYRLAAPAVVTLPSDVVPKVIQMVRRDPRFIFSRSLWLTPQLLAQPPPVETVIRVWKDAVFARSAMAARRPSSFLSPPVVVNPPDVFPYGPGVQLARHSRGATSSVLRPPPSGAVEIVVYSGPTVTLARTRPRPTTTLLRAPAALQTFAGPQTTIVRSRPRPTVALLTPPTVVRVPSVEQQQQTVKTTLARVRPRPTASVLTPPTALQVFTGPETTLTRTRPRATTTLLLPPAVVEAAAVAEIFYGPRASLAPARKPRVVCILPWPQVVDAEVVTAFVAEPVTVSLARRVRTPSIGFAVLSAPMVVDIPEALGAVQTTLVRTRPRATFSVLRPPAVVADALVNYARPVQVEGLRTRPRPTTTLLLPPTVVRVPSVEQEQQTVRVTTVQTRPRPTVGRVSPPTVLQVFDGPKTPLVQTRPRPTTGVVRPPTAEVELPVQAEVSTSVTRTRPRPTTAFLRPPPVVLAPSAEQEQRTLRTPPARTRPRATVSFLRGPVVLATPAPPTETTVKVTLVTKKPSSRADRRPYYFLSPPAVVTDALVTYGRPPQITLAPPPRTARWTRNTGIVPALTKTTVYGEAHLVLQIVFTANWTCAPGDIEITPVGDNTLTFTAVPDETLTMTTEGDVTLGATPDPDGSLVMTPDDDEILTMDRRCF